MNSMKTAESMRKAHIPDSNSFIFGEQKNGQSSTPVNIVYKTTDYDLFSFLSGNRTPNPLHIKRLTESFKERYLFSPIVVNEKYQVIDGQHRLTVAKALSYPVFYVIVPGYGLNEVHVLNSNSSNWKAADYLNGYCDLGYPEYIKFRNFMNKYPFIAFRSARSILRMKSAANKTSGSKALISESNKRGAFMVRDFEYGDFICADYDKSCVFAENLSRVRKFNERVMDKYPFVMALFGLFLYKPEFDFDEFIYKLSLQPTKFVDCVNITQFKELIEEIYNYKRRDKVNLRF